MSTAEHYDLISLGCGEAGKYITWHIASSGQRAAVVERKYIGGSCPNIACLPSKNIVHGAKVASLHRRGPEFGIVSNGWRVDMPAVRQHKRTMVDGLIETHLNNFKKSGADFIWGSGRFVAPKTLEVALPDGGTRTLTADKIVLNTGSRATIADTLGLREAAPLTHIEALELDTIPEHLLVLGGGYVGLELAQALSRFGARVTIIERSSRLLFREDPDVSEAIQNLFSDEGIAFITDARLTRVTGRSGERVTLELCRSKSTINLTGSHLLVATGRTPNTENIGLDIAGIAVTDRGFIKVNERLETTAPDVWALGDCAGSPLFTHIAFDDFRILRDNLAGGNRVTTGRQVPSCVFTDPELAHVGLTETEAQAHHIPYRRAKIPMVAVLRSRTLSETRGFLKALIDSDDRILGFTGFGTQAGELLPVIQLAMSAKLPYTAVRDLILTHPTINEGLFPLFSAVPPPA
jgi:pyruvate/2-oxoglutarate dehydrogenase complex dihydrolipoamide dehydrogenase (E3) component